MVSDDSERRAHTRYDVDAGIRIRPAGSTSDGIPCRLADAGRGGVAVVTLSKPDTDHLLVEILNNEGQPIGEPLEAEVVYVEALEGAGYRVGCRFEVPEELLPDEDE